MKVYIILCFDLYTGEQDICFYGKGNTESEAIESAKIPYKYEISELCELCMLKDVPEELIDSIF